MAKTLQFRRGTEAELDSITGSEGELFVDLTNDTIRVHDGTTQGGAKLAKTTDADSGDATTYANATAYADSGDATTYSNATSYADSGDATTYSNATSYADTAAATAYSNAESYADTGDATTYSNATSYTDGEISSLYTNVTSYADTGDATTYSNATSYADSGDATTYSNATSYTDGEISSLYTNVTSYADSGDATTYSNATAYADTASATAYTNAVAYVDAQNTDTIEEGGTNLYYLDSRVDSHLSGANGISYSSGVISVTQDISSGANVTFTKVTGLDTPSGGTDAATKAYVDEVAEGLQTKPAVEVITLSDLSATYDNGTSGVGATLTADSNTAWPEIDGYTVNSTTVGENGILVAGQANTAHNGRYNLTTIGDGSNPWVLTRCGVCDEPDEIAGAFIFVKHGTTYAGTGWVLIVDDQATFDVGTDAINVTQFSQAGVYTANNGLVLNGLDFSIDANAAIVANSFSGNGASITSVDAETVGGNTAADLQSYADTVAAQAYANATAEADGTFSTLGTISTQDAANVNITGGLIDNTEIDRGSINRTEIGLTTPADGAFANLSATNISGNGASVTSVNADTVGSNTAGDLRSYADSVSGTAYSNAVSYTDSEITALSLGTISTQSAASVNIDGGNIDGTAIGSSTASTGRFSSLTLTGLIDEKVHGLSGTSVALDPGNGTIQTHTLSGTTTYSDSFAEGESMTLMIDDGSGQSVNWPTMTWVNNGAAAPTLATSGYTVVVLWKVSSTLYGALVGDGS